MVTEHHDDRILVAAVYRIDQLCNEVVGVVNHIYIIFPLVIGFFRCSSGYLNFWILNDFFRWVITV